MLQRGISVRNWRRRVCRYSPPLNPPEQMECQRRVLVLSALAGSAAASFRVLAAAAARRDTARADERVREHAWAPARHPLRRAASRVSPAGKWWIYVPATFGASVYVLTAHGARGHRTPRSARAAAGSMLLASSAAAALGPAFDRWLPQPPAPPGHPSRREPVFPSGYTLGPSAVLLTTAYVTAREGLSHPGRTLPLPLLMPLATVGGRILEQKHWASDVLGGYLAGTAVAAVCAAAYEAVRTGPG